MVDPRTWRGRDQTEPVPMTSKKMAHRSGAILPRLMFASRLPRGSATVLLRLMYAPSFIARGGVSGFRSNFFQSVWCDPPS